MINNLNEENVKQKVDAETGNSVIKAIFEHISNTGNEYGIEPGAFGLEFTSTTEVMDYPNRCRMKVFIPEQNKIMAWFYKPSAVHFSRDRYSLGGILLDEANVDTEKIGKDIDQWLDWLDSGLDPEKRPNNWKSAVPYDIPH